MNEIIQIFNELFKYPLTSFGSVTALLSVFGTFYSFFSKIIEENKKLKEARESRFQTVLESNSLAELGSYLDEVIGNFQIREYGENKFIRKKINCNHS
jgi:hypothetical protein